jgi:hypothetical protein
VILLCLFLWLCTKTTPALLRPYSLLSGSGDLSPGFHVLHLCAPLAISASPLEWKPFYATWHQGLRSHPSSTLRCPSLWFQELPSPLNSRRCHGTQHVYLAFANVTSRLPMRSAPWTEQDTIVSDLLRSWEPLEQSRSLLGNYKWITNIVREKELNGSDLSCQSLCPPFRDGQWVCHRPRSPLVGLVSPQVLGPDPARPGGIEGVCSSSSHPLNLASGSRNGVLGSTNFISLFLHLLI